MAMSDITPPPKKRRPRKAALGGPDTGVLSAPPAIPQDVDVIVQTDGEAMPSFDPDTAVLTVPHEDGDVTVDFNPEQGKEDKGGDSKFDGNLADGEIDDGELGRITEFLLTGIEEDDKDRSEWLNQRADGLDLLGLKIEKPGSGNVGATATAVPGMSSVRDPILLEAVLRFQANAYGELCPSSGPVKTANFGDGGTYTDQLAEALEKDLNFYFTTTASEYYPDTRRMLFWVGYASGMFKKVYRCPLKRRPVSESVDATDLIVPSNVTDLKSAGRITHQISMRRSTMRRMQILGVYRDVDLTPPTPEPNQVKRKTADLTGLQPSERTEDQDYTVYECYCELDIVGQEHKEDGEPTGLPLPYRVTIDKDSRTILEVRRNWREDDEDFQAKIPFVAFNYASGMGVYGIGLLHILGNVTMALTAMLRESIDAGMFSNFPGFLFAKQGGRQLQNEFRIPPGGGAPIETGGKPIGDVIMPLPYKPLDAALIQLMDQIRQVGSRVGGTADTPVGEGKQDAPVGTTLAMIEQATKIESAVHKALHAAQAEEFQLLRELFREDPEALWRGNRRPALGNDDATRKAKFAEALEHCEIVPMADPNTPSHMHRIMKALAIKQLQAANPGLYNAQAVDKRILSMINVDEPDDLFGGPQQPPPPDPLAVGALQLKQQSVNQAGTKMMLDAHNAHADRQSKETIEAMKIAQSLAVHPDSGGTVNQQLATMGQFMAPTSQNGPAPGAGQGAGKSPAPSPKVPAVAGQQLPTPMAQPLSAPPMSGGGSVLPWARGGGVEDLDTGIERVDPHVYLDEVARFIAALRRPTPPPALFGPGGFYQ